MRLIALFSALLKKKYIDMKRYWFDTIFWFIGTLLLFWIVFYGAEMVIGPIAPLQFGKTLEGIVVGFMVWHFAYISFGDITWGIMEEARQGTLEQLYMCPVGFSWVMIFHVITSFIFSALEAFIVLLFMMASTGLWLHLDILSLVPLLTLTISGVYGLGFIMGGFALIFKRVESVFSVVQYVFVFFIIASTSSHSLVKLLPLSLGTRAIGMVMVDGFSLANLPLSDVFFLFGNSLFYLGLGFSFFKLFEIIARNRGLLGHY